MISSRKPSNVLRALVVPLNALPFWARIITGVAAVLLCAKLAIHPSTLPFYFAIPDMWQYIQIADGHPANVMQPFISRQLGAQLAGWLSRVFHWPVELGFFVETAVSLVVMAALTYWVMLRTAAPRWMLLAVAVVPFWAFQAQYFVLPDLWYSALLAIMLVMVARQQMFAAALMMFPLMLSRESTSLTLVCFLIAAWKDLRWRDRLVAVAATVAAMAVVARLAAGSMSNAEHLPATVYMFAKVPWNFMRNLLGVLPWSNVNTELCAVPRWSFPLHIGLIHSVGVCGVSSAGPLLLLQALLNNFGLLPVLFVFLWWRNRRFAGRSVLMRFSLLYGGASFLLSPFLGTWLSHLIGYGWPLFFVSLPMLFDEFAEPLWTQRTVLASLGFCLLHITGCVLAKWILWPPQPFLQAGIWLVGLLLLRVWFIAAELEPAKAY